MMSQAPPHPIHDSPDDQWHRLQELFSQAAEFSPAERDVYLRDACAGDPALARKLKLMFQSDDRQSFLDASIVPAAADDLDHRPSTLIGKRIDRYQILRLIAAGGMGTVYRAQQDHPRRMVALKVMNSGAVSRTALRRFETEADILGRLQHHAIAQIHDAGVFSADHGPQPYFAMELIDGVSITDYAKRHNLGTRQRLALVQKVCEGVEYAHSQGVIHRDLKPANILVDQAGQPKILDFGIARVTGSDVRATTLRTDVGQLLGTLSYMSPEQVAGDPTQIDARSDVYALGVIAYELLADRLPHDLHDRPIPEAMRMILDEDPTPLSSVARVFRGDLDTIIAKALEKDRARRYQSAGDFAGDIKRYLADEAVLARRPSTLYQLRKFGRRNKVLVGGVVAVVTTLIVGVIGTTIGLVRAEWAAAEQQRLRTLADVNAARATAAELEARGRFDQSVKLLVHLVSAYNALNDVPGATKARESLALQTINGLPRATDEGYGELSGFAGYAYQSMGEVQLVMGKPSAALENFRTSLGLWVGEAERKPDETGVLRTFAVSHWKMAEALHALGRHEEAKQFITASFEVLARLGPPNSNRLHDHYYGASHRRLAEIEAYQDLHEDARVGFERAIEYYGRALEAAPQNRPSDEGKAMALCGLGEVLLTLGQPNEAMQALSDSLHVVNQIAARSGSANVFARTHQSRALIEMSRTYAALGDQSKAIDAAQQACEISQALAQADSFNFESRFLAAQCLAKLGTRLREKEPIRAIAHWTDGLSILEDLRRADPDNALVQREIESVQAHLREVPQM